MELLTAAWIVPVSGPPLRDGRVAVAEGRIAWVGRRGDPGGPEGRVRDLGPGVLIPGLVNAHCHLELSHLRGIDRSGGFVPWIERLVEARWRASEDEIASATREAVRFLEAETATVAVGDVSNALAHLDLLAASPLTAVVFYELLGWDPARASEVLAAADERMAALPADLSARGVEVRLAAHAPYSVSPGLFDGLRRRGGPTALHLAESPAETRFLASGDGPWRDFLEQRGLDVPFEPRGVSPVRYVESLGVLAPPLVAAHCVQADAADRKILARTGVSAVICLTSNHNLGVGVPPVLEMLEAGVRLCLGTDSLASGDSLDVMGEVVALHRQFPRLDPAVILRMATSGGAEALGLHDLGTLAAGKRAEVAFAPAARPPEDPLAFLVSGDARPRRVAL